MKKKVIIIVIVAVIVALVILAAVLLTGKKELRFNTHAVAEETVEIIVMATGYVQPVEEVEVGTQVSGVIEKIYVDYNSAVKKGDLLAELDKMTLQEKLNQSNATLTSAQSELNYAQQNYNRVKRLHDAKAATDVEMEEATNKLTQAKTSVSNAEANVNQSKVNLEYAYIYSPIDGVILDKTVNTGQTVAASFNTPTLFTIAEDLTKMQVEADVDEADIGQVKVGQKVTFTVDAYYGDVFDGTVNQIRLQPIVTNNVVTYTVIVEAPNPEEKLFPGMTANINIVTKSETGLTIPVEAMNFQMTPDMLNNIKKSGNNVTDQTAQAGERKVWVKKGNNIEARGVRTGSNDGINVIAESGVIAGEEVVLSASLEKKSSNNGSAAANPLMPRRPGR